MCLRASGELPLADVVRNGEGEEAQHRGELLQGFLASQAVSQVSLVFLVLGRGQRSEDVAGAVVGAGVHPGVDAAQPGFGGGIAGLIRPNRTRPRCRSTATGRGIWPTSTAATWSCRGQQPLRGCGLRTERAKRMIETHPAGASRRARPTADTAMGTGHRRGRPAVGSCLLYTSDAADEEDSVDLAGS